MARARQKPGRNSHPILDRLLPALQPAGEARARAMFGGWGIYLDDVIVGLVAPCRLRRHETKAPCSPKGEYGDTLYFRVDEGNRPDYQAAGTAPFAYEGRSGKPLEMPYWEVPAEVFAEPDRLCDWALKARAASVAARQKTESKRRTAR